MSEEEQEAEQLEIPVAGEPIVVRPNWHRADPGEGDESDLGNPNFSLNILHPFNAMAGRVAAESNQPLLANAGRYLACFADAALADGYIIRLDPGNGIYRRGVWPRWCHTSRQFRQVLRAFHESIGLERHEKIYPLSIWFIPGGSDEGRNLVEQFLAHKTDGRLADAVLAAGVMRFSLDVDWFDLSSSWDDAERAVGWAKKAIPCAGVPLKWEPWP